MKVLLLVGTGAVAALLGLPLVAVMAPSDGPATAQPSSAAVTDIPPEMLGLYLAAAPTCPGLSWTVLAAIGKVESDHGRSNDVGVHGGENYAGAGGPMQFLAGTWASYGVDADGDGVANRYSPADAVYGAARYLCASGGGRPDTLRQAVFAYNHATWYVDKVLTLAASYGDGANAVPASSASGTPTGSAARIAVAFAAAQLGTPYRWGGEGPDGFDCSGLVQAAYAAAGVTLPRVAQAQFDVGPHLPAGALLQPGDLVFYGTSANNVTHEGMFIGNGNMIDAPHTGAVVRVEPYQWPNLLGTTRPTPG